MADLTTEQIEAMLAGSKPQKSFTLPIEAAVRIAKPVIVTWLKDNAGLNTARPILFVVDKDMETVTVEQY